MLESEGKLLQTQYMLKKQISSVGDNRKNANSGLSYLLPGNSWGYRSVDIGIYVLYVYCLHANT